MVGKVGGLSDNVLKALLQRNKTLSILRDLWLKKNNNCCREMKSTWKKKLKDLQKSLKGDGTYEHQFSKAPES